MKKSFIAHPFLFAIFPVLFLYSHNAGKILFSDTLSSFAAVLVFTFLLLLLLKLTLRDSEKAGVLVSLFLILFFSYGHVYAAIHPLWLTIVRNRYLLPVWSALFIYSAYLIIKTRKRLRNFTNILNIAAASLVITSLIVITYRPSLTKAAWQYAKTNKDTETSIIDSKKTDRLPDIYYIILDGYANSSTLAEIYSYDNSEFINYLIRKGFYVASKSLSNYAYTDFSLPSALNMQYVNYLSDTSGAKHNFSMSPYYMIRNSKVTRFLKKRGYKSIYLSTGWSTTDRNPYADLDIRCARLKEFEMLLINITMLGPFRTIPYYVDREKILYAFSKLGVMHKIKGPKFIFAHIGVPHPPFVFGKNGEFVPQGELLFKENNWAHKQHYLDQLAFVNKKVEALVEKILSESEIPPIIILQADHGPASIGKTTYQASGKLPGGKLLKERMRILNAYYLPDNGKGLLYESITPVNSFRLIFNLYFNTDYELLDDKSYFSGTGRYWSKITDVTDKVAH